MSLKGTTKQIFKFDLTAGSSDHLKIDALVWQYLKDVELKTINSNKNFETRKYPDLVYCNSLVQLFQLSIRIF